MTIQTKTKRTDKVEKCIGAPVEHLGKIYFAIYPHGDTNRSWEICLNPEDTYDAVVIGQMVDAINKIR